jgi:hypothetical protein
LEIDNGVWHEETVSCTRCCTDPSCFQVLFPGIGLIHSPMFVAGGPLEVKMFITLKHDKIILTDQFYFFRDPDMVLVSLIPDHKSMTIGDGDIVEGPTHFHVFGFEISIHDE